MQRGYKVRSYVSGKGKDGSEYKNFSLTVPNEIAEALPKNMTFVPKMTDDGLLYEPVTQARGIELPAWAKGNNSKSKRHTQSQSQSPPEAQAA